MTSIIKRLIGTGQGQVSDHHDVETVAGPDFQSWSYIKIFADDLAKYLAKSLAEGFGEGVAGTLAVGTIAGVIVVLAQIDGGDDAGHEDGRGYGSEPVIVDLVRKSGVTGTVCSGHSADVERFAVGEDQALPGHKDTLLSIGHVAGVCADEPTAWGLHRPVSTG